MATPDPKRLYKAWKGSNVFLCGGRLIFGPDVGSLLLTTFLIAGPLLAFCSQVILKIHHHASQTENGIREKNGILGFPVLVVAIVITILDLIFLFLTSSRDPGIVPRNARPPDSEEAFDNTTPSMEWINGRSLRLPRTKDVIVNGFVVKVKYCDTCLFYRLPRASHCSICNNCIKRFDHHCPWVGQCIGLRNYRFFFMFISSSTFLCLYVFTISWLNIMGQRKHYGTLLRSMRAEILSVVLVAYTFVAVWFVGGLTVFHLYLISTNQTTYENFRYHYDKKENPYNNGILGNFKELFFSKIPPSMNDFRSWVFEETFNVWSDSSSVGIQIYGEKEKLAFDMDNKLGIHDGMPIPYILQNLDYSAIDDESKDGSRHLESAIDAFALSEVQEPFDQGPRISSNSCREENGAPLAETMETANGYDGASTPTDTVAHVPQT